MLKVKSISVIASSAVDHGFLPWSGKTKGYKTGISSLSVKHTLVGSEST
jgi:hypothetical protein